MKFGDKLSLLRRKNGLSQEELGERLNVTRQTISKWELGQSKPDMDKLIEISKLLNVDFNQLADDNSIIEDNVIDTSINYDDPRPRKWLLVLLIIVAIVIVVVLANKFVTDRKIAKEEEKDNGGFFGIFETIFDTTFESVSNIEKDSFNWDFESRLGTESKTSVSWLLDDVITNNKTNSDHIIFVVFEDVNTSDPNEIKNIKNKLDDRSDYEVSADYDENGYINKITIEKIIDEVNNDVEIIEENEVDSFEISRFNSILEMYAGTKFGNQVEVVLDKVITSNKTNPNQIIRVVYGSINTTDENEIRNIKRGLDDWTEYEVILDYDEVGFVNQVTIEN